MATITLRPTSATASSWSSIANAYDGSTTTSATVSIRKNNYSSRTATFNFDTSSIPSGATINSATLYVNAKASANSRITLYADINGSSSSRVINSALTTTQGNQTADIKSYINSLSSVKLTGYMSSNTSTTFTLYEVYIVVDYTEPLATYTVTFVDWNGTVLKTQTVEEGSSATAPSNPSRTGYTFTGWDKTFTNVTSNLTVNAQYTINSYTVTFKDWNNTILKTETVNHGSNATPPTNPNRTGYTFTGWSGSYTNITSNTEVTATYTINSYTVTFKDYDNTTLKTETVNYQGSATPPSNPSREGYTFSGWDKSFTNITTNTIITAQYSIKTFTVTFKDWDGTNLKTETVNYGNSATPPNNPTREGYNFTGWDKGYTNVTSNLTITAQYTIKTYTVTFKDWDGTTLKTEIVNHGNNATPPSNPSREGYSFTGWSGNYTNVTTNVTITATYTLDTVYYTVIFVDWDNTVLKTQEVEEGNNATPPSNPTRERYKFYQWDKDYTNITSDIQIKALYHANALAIGNMKFDNIYLGNSKITSVYLGDMLLYEREKPLISLVSDGLIANLCEFDATNKKIIDTVGDYDLTITGASTTINDNNITVANVSSNQGNIILPMTELTQFTFSYVVESNWSGSQPTQIISGSNVNTFYMWFMTGKMNLWYKNVKVIDDPDYTTIGNDNVKFIDVVLDITNGTCQLYANGELKVSKTGHSLNQAIDNNLYLNHTGGYTSIGNFTLYSFKVYNRCLNQEEIQTNINYEKTKLGWT